MQTNMTRSGGEIIAEYVGKYKKLGWVGRVSDISGVMIQASRVIENKVWSLKEI